MCAQMLAAGLLSRRERESEGRKSIMSTHKENHESSQKAHRKRDVCSDPDSTEKEYALGIKKKKLKLLRNIKPCLFFLQNLLLAYLL